MIKFNVDAIMAHASYTRERVEELVGGRESLTIREIAGLGIPIADRVWAIANLSPPSKRLRERWVDCAMNKQTANPSGEGAEAPEVLIVRGGGA